MPTSYKDLCDRILLHCEQQQWYGPDSTKGLFPQRARRSAVNVSPDSIVFGYRGYLDDGKLRMRAIMHDLRNSFEFSPATNEQVQTTEDILGFSLPPLLHALYTNIANGGFGPAGITGTTGGYYYGHDGRYQTIEVFNDKDLSIQYVHFAVHDYPQLIELPKGMWPARFLHLCYWGNGEDSYIDATSGAIYFQTFRIDENNKYSYIFYQQEISLEIWIEHWLQNKMQHWFEWGEEVEQRKVLL